MDKIDKELLYWTVWKFINFIYGITLVLVILVGLWTVIYVLEGMVDEGISQTGLIKLWILIIVYIVIRNLVKPFFMRKLNRL